jgi:WD40 repeat protein
MSETRQAHPGPEQLARFGRGDLGPEEWAEVERHVQDCPACGEALRAVSDDRLASLLRACGERTLEPREAPPDTHEAATRDAPPGATPASPDVPAWLLDHPRYRVLGLLGAGGMGAVYRAEHAVMRRPVALKVISPGLLDNPASVRRFRREAQAAARLAHPHIVTAYDAEQAGDVHFLVLEYVEGVTLDRLVAEHGRLPVAEACDYARQAALGLQHAHEQGMVHRDLKPHNLMRTPAGQVKILDFGLARFALETTSEAAAPPGTAGPAAPTGPPPGPVGSGLLTQLGTVMGTPDFIAPEQARDAHTADIRADVYSLGCTLYYLLAGEVPFPEKTVLDKLVAHAARPPRPLSAFRRDVPDGLLRVLERMMAKDPARRYQTPAEVAEALAPFAGQGGRRRRGWRAAIVAAGLVLVVLGLLGYLAGPWAFRYARNRGQLDFDSDDPDAQVVVTAAKPGAPALDLPAARGAEVDAGEYQLRLLGGRPDLRLLPEAVTVPRAGRATVEVREVPGFVGETCCFTGHHGTVADVVFSPDGRLVLSCTGDRAGDNTLRLWESATGREVRRFQGHEALVLGVAFSPDGRLVLSGGWDGTVRLWDAATGQEVGRFVGHTAAVGRVAFSPDGNRAVSAGDNTVRVWEVATRKELVKFTGHTSLTGSVAFARDGQRVLSGGFDKVARLWDVNTGQELRRFGGPRLGVYGVALSPDGRLAVTAGDDVRLWDVETGREIRRLLGYPSEMYAAAFSPPDGRFLLTGGADGVVSLWDTGTWEERVQFTGHTGVVYSVAFAPDGRRAASASEDRTVRLWKLPGPAAPPPALAPGELRRFTGHHAPVKSVAFSPDGRFALSGSGYQAPGDYTLRLWDVETGRRLRVFLGHTGYVQCVAFAPDDHRALSGGADGTVRLWNVDTGAEVRRFRVPGQKWVNAVAFCPDGLRAVSAGDTEGLVRLWDLNDNTRPVRTYREMHSFVACVAVSPDGTRVVAGGGPNDPTVRVWDLATGRQLHRLTGHTGLVEGVAVSPDNGLVASAGHDRVVRLWDLETGQPAGTFEGHTDRIMAVAFSRDGSRLLSGSQDRTVRLWDVKARKELHVFRGHTDRVWSVAFDPNGHRALSGGDDRTLRLWDLTPPASDHP